MQKLPRRFLSTAVVAVTAFGLARWLASMQPLPVKSAAAGTVMDGAPGSPPRPSVQKLSPEMAGKAVVAGRYHDAVLAAALANPDLSAAVQHIMDHQEEDHCADTRLVMLVELLTVERLGEVGAALEKHGGNDYIVRHLMQAWAQRDAAGAMAWVEAAKPFSPAAIPALLTGWARTDAAAAAAWIDARPPSAASAELRSVLLETMAEQNAPAALALMKERGWLQHDANSLLRVMKNWAGTDSNAALGGLRSLIQELKIVLPTAATDENAPETRTFQGLLAAVLSGAGSMTTEERTALLEQLTPQEILAGRQAIVRELLSRNPALLESLAGVPLTDSSKALLTSLARERPGDVMSALGRVSDPAFRSELLASATTFHYSREGSPVVPPEARAAVAATLESMDPASRHRAAAGLASANAKTDPRWAAELVSTLPDAQKIGDAAGFFRKAAASDAALALETYRASSAVVQSKVVRELVAGLAQSAPQEGLREVLAQQDETVRASAAAALFAAWTVKDQGAAVNALRDNAAMLPAEVILKVLPESVEFRSPGGFELESLPTAAIEKELRALIPAPTPP